MVNDDSANHDAAPVPGVRDLLTLGGMLVGSIVVCVAVGVYVDHLAGSSPVGVLVGTGIGIVAAAAGFIVRVRSALRG